MEFITRLLNFTDHQWSINLFDYASAIFIVFLRFFKNVKSIAVFSAQLKPDGSIAQTLFANCIPIIPLATSKTLPNFASQQNWNSVIVIAKRCAQI